MCSCPCLVGKVYPSVSVTVSVKAGAQSTNCAIRSLADKHFIQ